MVHHKQLTLLILISLLSANVYCTLAPRDIHPSESKLLPPKHLPSNSRGESGVQAPGVQQVDSTVRTGEDTA